MRTLQCDKDVIDERQLWAESYHEACVRFAAQNGHLMPSQTYQSEETNLVS